MKLTNATEQAIAIMAIISMQEENLPVTSEIIHSRLEVSESYIKKLLRKLVVGNIIISISGNCGGFSLKKDIADINLLEIVESIEGKTITFRSKGVITKAFSNFDKKALIGEYIISDYFAKADDEWRNYLKTISIKNILNKVFEDDRKIPSINWKNL